MEVQAHTTEADMTRKGYLARLSRVERKTLAQAMERALGDERNTDKGVCADLANVAMDCLR
jgi:hypothetical protein